MTAALNAELGLGCISDNHPPTVQSSATTVSIVTATNISPAGIQNTLLP